MIKRPVVELSECVLCEVCIDVCPDVFSMNDAGFVQVAYLDEYPIESLDEAIKNCPSDCIYLEEI
jgi:ferredoxin